MIHNECRLVAQKEQQYPFLSRFNTLHYVYGQKIYWGEKVRIDLILADD